MKKKKVLFTESIERMSPGMYHGIIIWMKDGTIYTCLGDIRFDTDNGLITGSFVVNKDLMEQFS